MSRTRHDSEAYQRTGDEHPPDRLAQLELHTPGQLLDHLEALLADTQAQAEIAGNALRSLQEVTRAPGEGHDTPLAFQALRSPQNAP